MGKASKSNQIWGAWNIEQARTKRQRPAPRFSQPDKFVTFLIGKDDEIKTFLVHKEFACQVKAFEAAFSSDFVEGQTQTYRIEDTSEGAFRLLVDWLYTEKLDLIQFCEGYDDEDDEDHADEMRDIEYLNLCELWVLAEKFMIPRLQNRVIDSMVDVSAKFGHICSGDVLHYIYTNTPLKSLLQKYIVTEWCSERVLEGKVNCLKRNAESYPHAILIDIIEFMSNKMGPINNRQRDLVAEDFYVPVINE